VKPHPQVEALLEAAARSRLPTLDKVSPFVARRLYRERCAAVAPKSVPQCQTRLLLTSEGVPIRAYRAAEKDEVLPALVYALLCTIWVLQHAQTALGLSR